MEESLFITTPDSFDDASRTNTSFGLRALEHAHDEEVVPQIGSLEFVRQASWAVAAIKLFKDNEKVRAIAKTPTMLANAIEALGSKLEFTYAASVFKAKHRRGILAFNRSNSRYLWKFNDLKKKFNYVQNTYRQNVVGALQDLGLCDGGSTRFNQMQLTKLGEDLAEGFLNPQEGTKTKTVLINWVSNGSEKKDRNYMEILSPDYCSKAEKNLLMQCLNARVLGGNVFDPEKRIRLIKLLETIPANEKNPWDKIRVKLKDDKLGKYHCQQIDNAIRFEKIKNCIRNLYNECANYMSENNSNTCSFSQFYNENDIVKAYESFRKAVEMYRNNAQHKLPAESQKNLLITSAYKKIEDTLRYLVEHEGRALIYNGSGVIKGSLLKKDGFLPREDSDIQNWGHPKISQLNTLWRDCNE